MCNLFCLDWFQRIAIPLQFGYIHCFQIFAYHGNLLINNVLSLDLKFVPSIRFVWVIQGRLIFVFPSTMLIFKSYAFDPSIFMFTFLSQSGFCEISTVCKDVFLRGFKETFYCTPLQTKTLGVLENVCQKLFMFSNV